MNQTRIASLVEVITSTAIGYLVSLVLTAYLLPAYGHQVTLSQNLQITTVFTGASLLRSYLVRRFFNTHLQRLNKTIIRFFETL
jgi:uncharacterized membrane-anchored protein